jgi:putative spermidine/putrescine transport system ATP-binding protein
MIRTPAPLTFEQMTYRYTTGGSAAVSDVSIDVAPGELMVLVGPSGCGKSTLLRLVAGLMRPTTGRILMDGQDIAGVPAERRQVGWVPQSYALFDHLSVAENVAFGLKMRGIAAPVRAGRVQSLLELCELEAFARRHVNDLSGGQRQRVAIARALAIEPRVLLLDEPLAALDPQLRLSLRGKVEALIRASGVTTLFVTHDQSEALSVADRIVVLRTGRVEQVGPPDTLWHTPASAFVAEFLSGATVVPAQRIAPHRLEIVPGLYARTAPDPMQTSAVAVALRPADLQPMEHGVEVVVERLDYVGGQYHGIGRVSEKVLLPFVVPYPVPVGASVRVGIAPHAQLTVIQA